MEKILSAKAACDALSISKPTLYRLTATGLATKIQVSKGRVGWLASSIDSYIQDLIKLSDVDRSN